MSNKEIFLWVLKLFLIWRLGLCLAALWGWKYLPQNTDFIAGKRIEPVGGEAIVWQEKPLLSSWANFDGVHYLKIAQEGYHTIHYAFFPFYPLLIKFLGRILFDQFLIAGLIISNLSFLGLLFFLFKVFQADFSSNLAKRAVVGLLVFPTAFYFGSLYTESLFLLLVVTSFYAAQKKKWWLSGILGGLASATRLAGIFLFPALLLESYQQKRQAYLKIFLVPLGLFFYMLYLKKVVGDPLYFFHVLPAFGTGRTGSQIILPYQVVWRYFKIFWTVPFRHYSFQIALLEFVASFLFGGALLRAWLKKVVRRSFLFFSSLAFLTPTLTGTLSSMPRYVLVCFPCFLVLALIKNRPLRFALCTFSLALLAICTILFTRGYWVA